MSQRDMWKVLHLIHVHGRPGLNEAALRKAGITCEADTLSPLVWAGEPWRKGAFPGVVAVGTTCRGLLPQCFRTAL